MPYRHKFRAPYTHATLYFDQLFPVFARCCPRRMRHILFFLFPSISPPIFSVWVLRMCECVSLASPWRGSNSVIFSDFSLHMFVNVLLFRKLLAREMSFILGENCRRHIFFYPLFCTDRKRTVRRSGIVGTLNSRCNKYRVKRDISARNIWFRKKKFLLDTVVDKGMTISFGKSATNVFETIRNIEGNVYWKICSIKKKISIF